MKNLAQKFITWFEPKADTKVAKFWLFTISFTESFFFPIPADPFLAVVILVQKNKWIYFSALVTVASVLGGVGGYLIGLFLFETLGQHLIDLYHLQPEFETVKILFEDNAFWAIFTAAFTPIPYKIFTIAAGVAKLNIVTFIVASILGRGIRFFIVGFIVKKFGKQFYETFLKYFDRATIIVLILIIIYILFRIVV
jgi:membrane protein YqaA with SNARE-associated domain